MKNVFIYLAAAIVFSFSCKKNALLTPSVSNTTIQVNKQKGATLNIPYADSLELKSFRTNPQIVDFELARKMALLEMKETGFINDMGWNGYRLSKLPVAIFDLNSEPRYYDFIAINAEGNPVGTVRINATKKSSSVIEGLYADVFDYNTALTKAGSANASFFIDWKGEQFAGVKSKAGTAPDRVISLSTGLVSSKQDIQELEGREIIDYMMAHIFPELVKKDERAFENIPKHLLKNQSIIANIEKAKISTIGSLRDSMEAALTKTHEEAKAYWNALKEYETTLMTMDDEEITNDSKFLGRWWRRIFSRTDTKLHRLYKYDSGNNNEDDKKKKKI